MKAILSSIESLDRPLPGIRLIADSAIGRQREPYWLDTECGHDLTALLCPCYRIGRLGKNIDRRFAARYIDAFTLAALIIPGRHADKPLMTEEIFLASTNALIPGDDLPFGPEMPDSVTMRTGAESLEFSPTDFVCNAVSRLSAFMTFKNGDRLIDCSRSIRATVAPRTSINATLDGKEILKIKIL
ncbi:MAG: hypothetical protein K2H03_00375 [Muribaculaceae bacterium]|nr:hypothetical protein [Muribaculaceae bacterium]